MSLYPIGKALISIYYKLFFKWIITGKHHVPKNGPIILVANHISNNDPLVLACSVKRQVHYMAKEEVFKNPILGFLVSNVGSFPIKRGGNDRRAIKRGLEILKENRVLGIFPEGTRSKDGNIGKGLPGAALFALKSDAVVIPVAIKSTYRFFHKINIDIGEAIDLSSYKQDKITSETLDQAIAYIMGKISNQLEQLHA